MNKITDRYSFGHDAETANELAELVVKGIKTATCWRYVEKEEISKIGELSIIEDFHGKAMCVVETVFVDIVPFNKVTEEFRLKEIYSIPS